MIPYLVVAIIPLIFYWVHEQQNKKFQLENVKPRRLYIFLAALPMFILIGFRNQSIGADTINYLNHFSSMIDKPWSNIFNGSRMEAGYLIFVKLLTYITHSKLVYQVICASIYLFALVSFTNQLEKEHFLFLFLFATMGMYTFMFTGVRQCLAISLCMFSYKYIKKRKFIPFALIMLLAYFFHKSSVLFVVAYFIYSRKLSAINIIIYLALTGLCVIFLDQIQEWFNDALDYNYAIEGNTGGIIFTVIVVAITVYTLFASYSYKTLTTDSQGAINIGLLAVILWIVRIFTRVAERPSFYFLPFVFVGLIYAIAGVKNANEKKIIKMFLIVLSLALYVYRFVSNFTAYIPYSFFVF